jgi:hypothetical protein
MKISSKRKWSAATGGRGAAALGRLVAAAAIAALAASCSTMDARAQQEGAAAMAPMTTAEERDTPAVADLDPTLEEQIRAEALKQFGDLEIRALTNIFVVTAYQDSQGQEKLAVLGGFASEGELNADEFLVPTVEGDPPDPTAFKQAVVIFTASPAGGRSCGPPGSGTRYCRF